LKDKRRKEKRKEKREKKTRSSELQVRERGKKKRW